MWQHTFSVRTGLIRLSSPANVSLPVVSPCVVLADMTMGTAAAIPCISCRRVMFERIADCVPFSNPEARRHRPENKVQTWLLSWRLPQHTPFQTSDKWTDSSARGRTSPCLGRRGRRFKSIGSRIDWCNRSRVVSRTRAPVGGPRSTPMQGSIVGPNLDGSSYRKIA